MNPNNTHPDLKSKTINRRDFLATTASAVGGLALVSGLPVECLGETVSSSGSQLFTGADSLVLGKGWESLNPGYWQIKNGALRRRLKNVGERARRTGFPFHSETRGKDMQTDYDPSLPVGIVYRNDWYLSGEYTLKAEFTYLANRPEPKEGDSADWDMYQDGYAYLGLALGAKSIFEGYGKTPNAIQLVCTDDSELRLLQRKKGKKNSVVAKAKKNGAVLKPGDTISIEVKVSDLSKTLSKVDTVLVVGGTETYLSQEVKKYETKGYAGIAGRGLTDFEATSFKIEAADIYRKEAGHADCLSCYPLGDTLEQVDGKWRVKFIGIFDTDGSKAEIRIADSEIPKGGWASVPVAGTALIVSNDFRRNTAVIEATLPFAPNVATLYYTVWKDGVDVTADARIGTSSVGPGTGLVGDVPSTGSYVGRLPCLRAPYKLCGLSCHAITSGLQRRTKEGYKILGGGGEWQYRDQPTVDSYKHLEEYNFQVMVWEDDVWYMELALYPPSTDDAYKVIKNSICGPTSRWQCMRHWNIINPGDHDYGMDDVKGPEQIIIRKVDGLGQDTEYMRRNFQIVHHLVTGAEEVDPLENPKKWRAWKMPNRDFTLAILDSRLWRSSQDVDIWDDSGWGAFKNLYDRTDPTRSLLGEEQFAWLQELITTDSSKLICLTGINGMNTIWGGTHGSENHPMSFDQRDRVTADYAGWVKAGSDRVLELLGSRDGVVTVYGDVHNGCIMKNLEHNVIECSFGPIGRSGGRKVIPGFGPRMKDVDGRELEVHALYHKSYKNTLLESHEKGAPFYWNFLEMEFDPRKKDPAIGLRIRNMIDSPEEAPRGGSALETKASETGRDVGSRLPEFKTLRNADVRFALPSGVPLRATRSDANGLVSSVGLVDLSRGSTVVATAWDGRKAKSTVLKSV